MRVLLLLCSLFFLAACSKSQKAKLEITTSFAFGGTNLAAYSQGGLMIWGLSSAGDSFSRVLNDTDSLQVDVPNGSWIFSAVAWANPNNKTFEAVTMRCARSSSTSLNGGEASLNLVLTADACENPHFRGGPSVSAAEVPLSLQFCKGTRDIAASTDVCTDNPITANRKADKAPVMSVRLKMAEYDQFGGKLIEVGNGLSRCVAMPSSLAGEWTTTGDFNVPVGDPADPKSSPFRMELDLHFSDTTCSGSDPSKIVLPNGLVSTNLGHKYFGDNVSYQILYVNVPDALVCVKGKNTTPFAGGDGSKHFPNLICSEEQLYNIHDATTDLNHSFRLMTDIDLNKFSKGLSAAAPAEWPAAASCWSEGQNWQPIGYDVNCALISGGFKGSFNGGDHTITGMRMRLNHDKVGFVGEWGPVASGHVIRNLILEKPEIEGTSYVGGLVGSKSGSLYSLIANSEVRGGEVIAGEDSNISKVGGILGSGTRAQLLNLKTSRVKIEGEGDYIGGIFGFLSGTQQAQKLVSRSYVGGPDWSGASYVGGIGGSIGSDNLNVGEFGEWATESIVVGKMYVGGLLGEWGSTLHSTAVHRPLENVYAAGAVSIRGQMANHLGGLFGTNYNNAVLNNAYFAGSVLNDSYSANCGGSCDVGWLSGYARAMTRTQVYVMTEDDGTHYSLLPRGASFGDDPDGPSGAPPWTIPPVSTTTIFVSGTLTGLASGPWVHRVGDKPRLLFESHPCSQDADTEGISPRDGLAAQKLKWGTATKPLMICRKDQFAEITSHLGSGKIGVIVGALNLASSAAHVKPNLVAGAYLTGEGGYIHGLRRVEDAASFQLAPFGTISGVLKHLLIAGIELRSQSVVTGTSSVSSLALANAGLVEDVKWLTGVLHHEDMDVNASGLVATNLATGTLRDVSVEGSMYGSVGKISGVVTFNNGTIVDSRAAARLGVYDGGSDIAGVARTNAGTIQRVSMSSKFDSEFNTNFANELGMVAVTNTGTILDVHVTGEAYWRAKFGTNAAQVAATHSGVSASIKRVVVEGFLYDVQDTTSFSAGNLNFVQTLSSPNISSMFVVPAGRLIGEGQGAQITSCNAGTNSLVLHASFPMPSAFVGAYWVASMLTAGKVVWAVFDHGNGRVRYAHVVNGAMSGSLTAALSQNCDDLGYIPGQTRIRLVQDYGATLVAAGATGELTTAPGFIGFTEDADPFSAANLTGPAWNENISGAPVSNTVVARESPGMDWILDVMSEFLGVATTATPKPIWEVENDERIELFRIKK